MMSGMGFQSNCKIREKASIDGFGSTNLPLERHLTAGGRQRKQWVATMMQSVAKFSSWSSPITAWTFWGRQADENLQIFCANMAIDCFACRSLLI